MKAEKKKSRETRSRTRRQHNHAAGFLTKNVANRSIPALGRHGPQSYRLITQSGQPVHLEGHCLHPSLEFASY
jgi:hypothetical protein